MFCARLKIISLLHADKQFPRQLTKILHTEILLKIFNLFKILMLSLKYSKLILITMG